MFSNAILFLLLTFHSAQLVDEEYSTLTDTGGYSKEHNEAKSHLHKAGEDFKDGFKEVYDSGKHEAKAWKNKLYSKKDSYQNQEGILDSDLSDDSDSSGGSYNPPEEDGYFDGSKRKNSHIMDNEDRYYEDYKENLEDKANVVTKHVKEDGSYIVGKGKEAYDSAGKKIKEKFDQAGEKIEDFGDGLENAKEKVKDYFFDTKDQVKKDSEDVYEKGKQYGDDLKQNIKSKKSKLSDKTKKYVRKTKQFFDGEGDSVTNIKNKLKENSKRQKRRIKLKTLDYIRNVYRFLRSSIYFIGDRIDDMVGPVFVPITSIYFGVILLWCGCLYKQGMDSSQGALPDPEENNVSVFQNSPSAFVILSMLILELNNFSQIFLHLIGMLVLANMYLLTTQKEENYSDIRKSMIFIVLTAASAFSIVAGVKGIFFEDD